MTKASWWHNINDSMILPRQGKCTSVPRSAFFGAWVSSALATFWGSLLPPSAPPRKNNHINGTRLCTDSIRSRKLQGLSYSGTINRLGDCNWRWRGHSLKKAAPLQFGINSSIALKEMCSSCYQTSNKPKPSKLVTLSHNIAILSIMNILFKHDKCMI